jgi:hypothetical protein
MALRLVGKIVAVLWRTVRIVSWCLLGLWASLAVFFNAPLAPWLATCLALGVALLYVIALPERLFARGRAGSSLRENRCSVAALVVTALVAAWYFGFETPDPNQEWIPKHAQMPHVEVVDHKVHVNNVRNFAWRTPTDFTPEYCDRVYDLSALDSAYYVLSPIFQLDEVAHVWVSFGFTDGQHVAVSVEARLTKGNGFRFLGSMFRQFQLIYVIGEERDVVGLRGAIWKYEVRFYPARLTKGRLDGLFLDMMERAHSLEEHPEFYNLFTNNCMNNISFHLRRQCGRPIPSELRLLLTGFSDQAFYEYGLLDTNLPFAKAHEAYRIDPWVRTTPLDETFSLRLRETLRRQGADKVP